MLCAPITPAAMELSRLLLHDLICSQHVTMYFQRGGNLSPVTLTFDIQTRPSKETRLPCEFGANPFSSSRDISHTNKQKKVTDSAKNRTLRSSLRVINSNMSQQQFNTEKNVQAKHLDTFYYFSGYFTLPP